MNADEGMEWTDLPVDLDDERSRDFARDLTNEETEKHDLDYD